jgi:hypothetical protein
MPTISLRKNGPNIPRSAGKVSAGTTGHTAPNTAEASSTHAAPSPIKSGGSSSGSQAKADHYKIHDLTEEESQLRARLRSKLNRQQAAAYLSDLGYPITANRLSKFVGEGGGPEYTKFGKQVYYYPDVLLAWAKAREQIMTGKHGTGHSKK